MNTKHPLATQRAKMAALENLFAKLAEALGFTGDAGALEKFCADPSFPKPCYISDLGYTVESPTVNFSFRAHEAVFTALGRTGWKRVTSHEGGTFHFRKKMDGVYVDLVSAQSKVDGAEYAEDVDPDFFPEAALPAHSVREVSA